ncbi:hypothetical protein FB451DRAFT_1176489 [Mycena latifolia]|nr:hypothetical protein FB451DRAFT_1176489 [Mycena latifolia]
MLKSDSEEILLVKNSPKAEPAKDIFVQDTRTDDGAPSPSCPFSSRKALNVHGEEIEDEYWEAQASMPKAKKYVIELAEEGEEEHTEIAEVEPNLEENRIHEEEQGSEAIGPPPAEMIPIQLKAKRVPKAGDSAIGVSVLAVKGWIEDPSGEPMDLQLDSCADITLVSEEFHNTLKSPPPIREGHQMSLAQLTDQGTTIKGYTKLRVFMLTTDGEMVYAEAEAYVV